MVEAAGVEHVGEPAGRSHLPDNVADNRSSEARDGGGGGSRTRVRKSVPAGIYMRVRFWVLMPGVRKRRKTAGHQTRKHLTPERRAAIREPA